MANENGERQIACAVPHNGEETYIGNQILRCIRAIDQHHVEHVIKHPGSDLPAYSVEVLVPVPKHPAAIASPKGTSAASAQPTPAPSPPPELQRLTKILSVPEVTTLFLRSLLQSATDYLRTRVDGAVLAVPTWSTAGRTAEALLLPSNKDEPDEDEDGPEPDWRLDREGLLGALILGVSPEEMVVVEVMPGSLCFLARGTLWDYPRRVALELDLDWADAGLTETHEDVRAAGVLTSSAPAPSCVSTGGSAAFWCGDQAATAQNV
ncbi:hypothetical protein AURDEDRAFT_164316 [Auricularia subglabra TFB-10046 SS5]|nr:hypothetical protein AURDEDRAFT_164316 [Auricularia subglabra TFB-10046 SS5]